jgi:serine protease inhibitor
MTGTCDPAAARGLAKLGLAIFGILAAEDASAPVVLISPISIASALGLAAAGATPAGAAEQELLSTLGVQNHEQVAEVNAALWPAGEPPGGVQLLVANSLWVTRDVRPTYSELVERTHGALAARLGSTYDECAAPPLPTWARLTTRACRTPPVAS